MAKKKQQRTYQLIAHEKPKSAIAEAYRSLRTNLGFASIDQENRVILLTSSSPMDGKSTITANLAVVLAQAGNKVVVVDCDLRKPVQHKVFSVDNSRGLTSCLLGQTRIEDAVHETVVENLSILPSGPIPPNPAEIIGSSRTAAFWQTLRETYDYVIIDAPPVLAVADASILSSQVDGVIMVIRSGNTRNDVALEAKEQLQKANAHIIGVVLNQVNMEGQEYKYYYYYSNTPDK